MLFPVWIFFMAVISTMSNFPGSDSSDQNLGKKIRFFCQFLVNNTLFCNVVMALSVLFCNDFFY